VTEDIINSASPQVILMEKPFCTDSKSGEQLLELAQQSLVSFLLVTTAVFTHQWYVPVKSLNEVTWQDYSNIWILHRQEE
jgi:hypothetical protein